MIRKEKGKGKNKPIFIKVFDDCNQKSYSFDPWINIDNKIIADKILNQIFCSDFFNFDNKLSFYLNYYQDMSQYKISDYLNMAQSTINDKIRPVMDYVKEFVHD